MRLVLTKQELDKIGSGEENKSFLAGTGLLGLDG